MREVAFAARSIAGLEGLARASDLERFGSAAVALADRLDGHTLWHVNSTAEGGGVAELLHQLLGYLDEPGIACRWMTIEGTRDFFEVTKRLHNRLHGVIGDRGELGPGERDTYLGVLSREVPAMLERARPGDVAVLHDPQAAGLVGPLLDAGLAVVWVCHVGVDEPNELARSAWAFLRPEIERADAYVFSRRAYVWDGLAEGRAHVIPPCVDPTSAKNAEIGPPGPGAVLAAARVQAPLDGREDAWVDIDPGGAVRVHRKAEVVEERPAPAGSPLVVQVSRWDRLKDHLGVLRGFAAHVAPDLDAHLLLVGPAADSVSDDPEGAEVFAEIREAWQQLPASRRGRIHLVNLPVLDREENAVVVNALQRCADVVVQKSLAEGFGLTVAEAMWKGRPVVGSRVGGIQDQIEDGTSGLLVAPSDLAALGRAVSSLIGDAGYAQAIGHAARERVRDRYLPPHFLGAHLDLVQRILGRDGPRPA